MRDIVEANALDNFMMKNDEGVKLVVEAGGIDSILLAMKNFRLNRDTQLRGYEALWKVCQCEGFLLRVRDADAFGALGTANKVRDWATKVLQKLVALPVITP